eukprot:4368615-Amphidinium_carterae.1
MTVLIGNSFLFRAFLFPKQDSADAALLELHLVAGAALLGKSHGHPQRLNGILVLARLKMPIRLAVLPYCLLSGAKEAHYSPNKNDYIT